MALPRRRDEPTGRRCVEVANRADVMLAFAVRVAVDALTQD
jgi:hypothetical protein